MTTKYTNNLSAPEVDIVLLLEGTYPYVLGGVSSWVHQIISAFSQYTFGLIFLGGSRENYPDGIRYKIPANVTHFQTHYLFEDLTWSPPRKKLIGHPEAFQKVVDMHDIFKCPQHNKLLELGDLSVLMGDDGINYEQFLYGKMSWDYLLDCYTKKCEDAPFIEYFWTIKNIHHPLWTLAELVKNIPKSKLVHTVSTGYAGLLSFLHYQHTKCPVVLTEHGMYTRERKIDIFLSTIFHDDNDRELTEASYLRALWDRFFKTLSQLSYHVADPVVSLFNQAHNIQIEDGADPAKAMIIPNGVDIDRYRKLRLPLKDKSPIVCFVGRMVPMKDIKCFIRAVPHLLKYMPHLKFWIIGSTDQDPQYAIECRELVENILLQDFIEFKPHQDMKDVLPHIQLLVLSALRESMPLVILESFAAGVPVVATDVGACRDMILGANEDDCALGAGGKVVSVSNPEGLANAIVEVLSNADLWNQMSNSAIARVEKYYDEKQMFQSYQAIYDGVIQKWQV